MKSQLERQLTGIAGVYFVAAELSRRGYVALATSRNLRTYDIIAYKPEEKRVIPIQVKTRLQHLEDIKRELTPSIIQCKGIEIEEKVSKIEDVLFIFVYLYKDLNKPPRFFIVPSSIVKELIIKSWEDYIQNSKHKKPIEEIKNNPHPMGIQFKYLLEFENKWDLLNSFYQK
jgi:hypothetical protein